MTRFAHRFDRPVFIVSTPRSGSTLLFETIEQAPAGASWRRLESVIDEALPIVAEADARAKAFIKQAKR